MNNNFYNDLIKASKFCNEKRNKIYLEKTEIFASDGYRLILLRNKKIPIEFQNKVINANLETFDTIKKEIKSLEDIELLKKFKTNISLNLKFGKEKKENVIEIKIREFIERFCYKDLGEEIVILQNQKEEDRVAINKGYLSIALNSFEGNTKVTILYPHYRLAPLLIEGESQLILIMPIKVDSSLLA